MLVIPLAALAEIPATLARVQEKVEPAIELEKE